MKKIVILFLFISISLVNGQTVGMWSAGSFGGPVSWGIPSGSDIYFSQGNKLHKGNEGAENIEIVSTSFLLDATTQIKINGDNFYAIYGTNSENKNNITSTTLSNLGSSSSNNFAGINNGINKFDEIDGFGLLAHNKDGVLSDKLVGEDLLGNTNDSFEYVIDFKDFAINGYIAYLITDDGTTDNTIEVIDFSAKTSAQKVGSIQVNSAQSVYYSNGYLYVACENGEGLKIIDVSNSTSPVLTGAYDANSFLQVIVEGTNAYLRKNNVLTILNISDPANPTFVNSKTLTNISASVKFTDVVNDKIYYVDNGIFGIIDAGTLNISQKYLSALSSDWVASDNTTLVVYDKTNYYFHSLEDVYNPKAYAVLAAEFEPVDFVINGTDFYVTDATHLSIYNTENLTTPSTNFNYFGTYSAFKVANDFAVVGEYKYEGSIKNYYFEIIDLTDKSNPTQLHLAEYPTVGTITSIELSPDNNTLYLASELEGKVWLTIFDITNKSAPVRKHTGELAEINSGKDTKLGIDGTELFVVTNYLTLNSYYAAKIFAYSVEDSSNPRLISGLQITESEFNNVSFLEELLFVTIPTDKAIRMYSLDGDSTFRKEWTQVKTLDLDEEPANMAVFVNKEAQASVIKGDSKFRKTTDGSRTGTLYKGEKNKGTGITYIKLKPKVKVQLTTSVLPAEAAAGGCTVSPSGGEYDRNESVAITSSASTGWVFNNWSGDLTGSANPSSVTMSANKNVVGNFQPILNLSLSSPEPGNHCPPGGQEEDIHIATANISVDGVDWWLTGILFTAEGKAKAEYVEGYIEINGKEYKGVIGKNNDGEITQVGFSLDRIITKGTTLPVKFFYRIVIPYESQEFKYAAALNEVKELKVSTNISKLSCVPYPLSARPGVKLPLADQFSEEQTMASVWNVSYVPAMPFSTIKEALDDEFTNDGHIIELCDGYYKNSSLSIEKSVTIQPTGGTGKVYLDTDELYGVFIIHANDVTIQGLTLANRRSFYHTDDDSYVYIIDIRDMRFSGYNNITIKNNIINITKDQIGIKGETANIIIIEDNTFIQNHSTDSQKEDVAIKLKDCKKTSISRNYFEYISNVIQLSGTNDNNINKNEFYQCKKMVYIKESDETKINDNIFRVYNDYYGIVFQDSEDCEFKGNSIYNDNLQLSFKNSKTIDISNNITKTENKFTKLYMDNIENSNIYNNEDIEIGIFEFPSKNKDITIQNNKCSSLFLEGVIKGKIENNTIQFSSGNGIDILRSSNIDILKNKILNTGKNGIYVFESDNVNIKNKNDFKLINGIAILLEKSFTKSSVYTIRNNTINHVKDKIAILALYIKGEVNFIANNISNASHGVFINAAKGSIVFNRFYNNGTAIKTVSSDSLLIAKNYIENSTDDFTGIHLDNTIATVEDNNLTANNGAAIGMFNGAKAKIAGNNIYDNPNLAVYSDNPTTVVNVNDNYWGSADEPSSDIFEGNINYSTWLTNPVSLVLGVSKDTVTIPTGSIDSVLINIQNFVLMNDQSEIKFTDENGWLINGETQIVDIEDSLISSYNLKFQVPSDAGSNFNNKVTISAVSLTNSEMTAVDSFYILNYTPELVSIKVSPDSIAIGLGDSLQFRAYATDQYEKEFSGTTNYNWSVSAGTIDSLGYFIADSTLQVVTVTATETNSNITASANINIQPHTDIAETITIYPDSITVPINGTVQFYAEGKDVNGFDVEFNKLWFAVGGTIDSIGYFIAGDIAGEYNVIVRDQLSGAESVAKVIVGTPTSVESERIIPKQYSLNQNYPNPFNPSTTINYALPYVSKVQLSIYNILGQRVKVLVNNTVMAAGNYNIQWNASSFSSGLYLLKMDAKSISTDKQFHTVKKMLLVK